MRRRRRPASPSARSALPDTRTAGWPPICQAVRARAMPVDLFCSYSHKDEALREELDTHLALLRRRGVLNPWHDRRIAASDDWKESIDGHLESADIVLLLISPDFMASDYCYDVEMTRAME